MFIEGDLKEARQCVITSNKELRKGRSEEKDILP